jgi:hypothetical protein
MMTSWENRDPIHRSLLLPCSPLSITVDALAAYTSRWGNINRRGKGAKEDQKKKVEAEAKEANGNWQGR